MLLLNHNFCGHLFASITKINSISHANVFTSFRQRLPETDFGTPYWGECVFSSVITPEAFS